MASNNNQQQSPFYYHNVMNFNGRPVSVSVPRNFANVNNWPAITINGQNVMEANEFMPRQPPLQYQLQSIASANRARPQLAREREIDYRNNDNNNNNFYPIRQFPNFGQINGEARNSSSSSMGLSQRQIDSLPTFRIKSRKELRTLGNENQCVICFDEYKVNDELRTMVCFHRFHLHCIDEWLSTSKKCPICKRDCF